MTGEQQRLIRLALERAERIDKWTCGKKEVPQSIQDDALAVISLIADVLHPDSQPSGTGDDAHEHSKRQGDWDVDWSGDGVAGE